MFGLTVNAAFGEALDALIVVDLLNCSSRLLTRQIADEGYNVVCDDLTQVGWKDRQLRDCVSRRGGSGVRLLVTTSTYTPHSSPATRDMPLQPEIGKRQPFDSPGEEVHLAIVRTGPLLESPVARLLKPSKLTPASYNVLRILRVATTATSANEPKCPTDGPARRKPKSGELTSSAIGRQMVTIVPDVTRLVDRLEKLSLVARRRCEEDRRVVYVCITPHGLSLLARLDAPIRELVNGQLAHLTAGELTVMLNLLDKVRRGLPID